MSTSNYRLEIEGTSIAVLDSGGPGLPVLMLHGSGSSKEVFSYQFESPLAGLFRLIAPDLPGHGESENAADPDTGYTLPALARTCGAVLDALGIDRAALFGWSLGGHIAIEMLTRQPAAMGLMLSGTPPVGKGPLAGIRAFQLSREVLLGGKENYTATDSERFLRMCFGNQIEPEMRMALARADGRMRPVVTRSLSGRDSADQRWVVEHTPLPVAMINGADDPVVRLSYLNGIDYANLWDARCHALPRAGHAVFRDAPETFNRLFHRFAMDVTVSRARPATATPAASSAARRA